MLGILSRRKVTLPKGIIPITQDGIPDGALLLSDLCATDLVRIVWIATVCKWTVERQGSAADRLLINIARGLGMLILIDRMTAF